MKHNIFLVFIFINSISLTSQNIIIDFGDNDRTRDIIQLDNGNYLMQHYRTESVFALDTKMSIINPLGDIIWTAPESFANVIYGSQHHSFVKTDEGNTVFLLSNNNYIRVKMIDQDGNDVSDNREYYQDEYRIQGTFQLNNQIGCVFSSLNDLDTTRMHILGVNDNGDIIWRKRLKETDAGYITNLTDIKYNENTNSYFVYWNYDIYDKREFHVFISEYDENFNFKKTHQINSDINSRDVTTQFVIDDENNFIFGQNINDVPYVEVLDENFNSLKSIPVEFKFNHVFSDIKYHDKKIYLSGVGSDSFENEYRFWVMVLGESYNILYENIWGRQFSGFRRIKESIEGELFLAGSISDGCNENSNDQDNCIDSYIYGISNIEIPTSLNDPMILNKQINIYPNPSLGLFNINGLEQNIGKVAIRIYNINGQFLSSSYLNSKFQIDLENYKSGIYIIKISLNDNIEYINRIVKM